MSQGLRTKRRFTPTIAVVVVLGLMALRSCGLRRKGRGVGRQFREKDNLVRTGCAWGMRGTLAHALAPLRSLETSWRDSNQSGLYRQQ